jgi:hypothetical protein
MQEITQLFLNLWSPKIRFVKVYFRPNLCIFILAVLVTLFTFQAGAAEKVPSGKVTINETEFGFILNGNVGKGTLDFRGKEYTFEIGGIKVGGLGVSKISAVGEVYDLHNISQFPGTYVAGEYGITLGGGMGGLILKNENGVYLHLKSTSEGIALQLGAEGLTIKLK